MMQLFHSLVVRRSHLRLSCPHPPPPAFDTACSLHRANPLARQFKRSVEVEVEVEEEEEEEGCQTRLFEPECK